MVQKQIANTHNKLGSSLTCLLKYLGSGELVAQSNVGTFARVPRQPARAIPSRVCFAERKKPRALSWSLHTYQ